MHSLKTQRSIRFQLEPLDGESANAHKMREAAFNSQARSESKLPSSTLLAQLLKRQARQALHDITTCAPNSIGVCVNCCRALCELIDLAVRHELISDPERFVSGLQLAHPSTVLDFRACLDHALQHHRSPISNNDEVINRLDLIAGEIMRLNCARSSTPVSDKKTAVNNGGGK